VPGVQASGRFLEFCRRLPKNRDDPYLTIVADTPERPVSMREIGSGENHLSYHIVTHLALLTRFANRARPVPACLLLDQPFQAHFSPDTVPGNGMKQEKIDADRQAVKRHFGLIFEVVESLDGNFQVLITDHPDFSDDARFQAALHECWRDGLKLVPRTGHALLERDRLMQGSRRQPGEKT